jgi:hypothetical protein
MIVAGVHGAPLGWLGNVGEGVNLHPLHQGWRSRLYYPTAWWHMPTQVNCLTCGVAGVALMAVRRGAGVISWRRGGGARGGDLQRSMREGEGERQCFKLVITVIITVQTPVLQGIRAWCMVRGRARGRCSTCVVHDAGHEGAGHGSRPHVRLHALPALGCKVTRLATPVTRAGVLRARGAGPLLPQTTRGGHRR